MAVVTMKRQNSKEAYYSSASVLVQHAAALTVDSWMQNSDLDPARFVHALLRYSDTATVALTSNQAVRYFFHAINNLGNTDSIVHNALVSILAKQAPKGDEKLLLQYLRGPQNLQRHDPDYTIRVCKEFGRLESVVTVYCMMNMHQQAVEMALTANNTDLASFAANKLEDDDAQRKLFWKQIAKHLIASSDNLKDTLSYLKSEQQLTIEDLIPLLSDFSVIDDIKDDVCEALETYGREISRLQEEMNGAEKSAKGLERDIENLKHRFVIVKAGERCQICLLPLLTRQFFVFPCHHAFHGDCLSNHIKTNGSALTKSRIAEVESALLKAEEAQRTQLTASFDRLVAGECILCGIDMVRSIGNGFDENKVEKQSWEI